MSFLSHSFTTRKNNSRVLSLIKLSIGFLYAIVICSVCIFVLKDTYSLESISRKKIVIKDNLSRAIQLDTKGTISSTPSNVDEFQKPKYEVKQVGDYKYYSNPSIGLSFRFPSDWDLQTSNADTANEFPCVIPVASINSDNLGGLAVCVNFDPIIPLIENRNENKEALEGRFLALLNEKEIGYKWDFRTTRYQIVRKLQISGLKATEVLVKPTPDMIGESFYNHVIFIQHPTQGLKGIVMGETYKKEYIKNEPMMRSIVDSVSYKY